MKHILKFANYAGIWYGETPGPCVLKTKILTMALCSGTTRQRPHSQLLRGGVKGLKPHVKISHPGVILGHSSCPGSAHSFSCVSVTRCDCEAAGGHSLLPRVSWGPRCASEDVRVDSAGGHVSAHGGENEPEPPTHTRHTSHKAPQNLLFVCRKALVGE